MTMVKVLIGVMGPGEQATPAQCAIARALGEAIATAGWVLLTGGRNVGVMAAATQGAQAGGGLTVGILPGNDGTGMSLAVDIPIYTGMGQARNVINVWSSRVVVALGSGPGTVSEMALAIKAQKPLILLQPEPQALRFWQELAPQSLTAVDSVPAAIAQIRTHLSLGGPPSGQV